MNLLILNRKENALSLVVTYTRSGLQSLHLSLWCPSERLSAKLDGELDKKPDTMNEFYFVCYCLAVFRFFLDCTENVMYFSVFSPKHSNKLSNS